MVNAVVISAVSLGVSVASFSVAWRAYRRDTVAHQRSLATAKAIAAQRLTLVLDFGLKLNVVNLETVPDFCLDAPVFADMAKAAVEIIDDVALAFPNMVQYLDELRRNAELGSQLSARAPLTNEQATALVWHYERVYTQLDVLSAYALARHDPTRMKQPLRKASSDKYVKPFASRHTHFMATAYKLSGMLPESYPIPKTDSPDHQAELDRRSELEKLRTSRD